MRRSSQETLELCAADGQRVTVRDEKWTLVMCHRENRIFYVWINKDSQNHIALAKDVTAAESIPASQKGKTEDLRIQVLLFCEINLGRSVGLTCLHVVG